MPFPYELYPKAKETHCLNLPEISVSRPPFPGSIRTADGCFWGERNNNSYVSTHKTDKVCTADGKCYNYNDVFVDEVDPGYSNTCGQTCYVACSCNTSNGWYSSCQGSDCFSVTDTRYAGKPNAASASRSLSDVTSISASGVNSGISASAAANSGLKTASATGNYTATAASAGLKTASVAVGTAGATSGISTMASGATTCYKKKTCSEGGYYDSVPADQKCSSKSYNGYSCYTGCSYKTCSDYGYNSSIPSGKTCTAVYPRSGLTCYKDCKDDYFTATIELCVDIKDKDTQQSITTPCGFNGVIIYDKNGDDGKVLLNVYGTKWHGTSTGYWGENCSSTELTFEASEDPVIVFAYQSAQSTWTCGYYTTMCNEYHGTNFSTSGLTLLGSTQRGAFVDYKYRVTMKNSTARISVNYQCNVSKDGNPIQ